MASVSQVQKAESASRVARKGTSGGGGARGGTSTRAPAGATRAGAAARAEAKPRSHAGLEIYGLLLTAFAILLLLSLVSFDPRDTALDQRLRAGPISNLVGPVGAHIADLLFRVLGLFAIALCSTFFYFGGLLLAGRRPSASGGGLTAYITLLVCGGALAHVTLGAYRPFGHMPGGLAGAWVGEILRALFASAGTLIITSTVTAAAVLRLSGLTLTELAMLPARLTRWAIARVRRLREERAQEQLLTMGESPLTDPNAFARVSESGPPIVTPARRPVAPEVLAPEAQRVPPPIVTQAPMAASAPRVAAPAPARAPAPAQPVPLKVVPQPPRQAAPAAPLAPARPTALHIVDEDDGADLPVDFSSGDGPTPAWPAVGEPVIEDMLPVAPPVSFGAQENLPLDGPTLPFEFPSLTLLDYEPPKRNGIDREALAEAAATLEAKLADFGVKGKVVKIQPGPVVTMFEFLPAPGIKISKISGLVDDLTMALHAQRVRIVAPIPGKGVVGIEVPSAVRETVYLKEILAAKDFQETRAKLPICLGKDIVGLPIIADLAKAPHMLVAGATGSGKSVAINAFILSLVYKNRPEDLKLILVDPKMLELSVYDDIPHLLLPVVTDPKKASLALKWAVAEMERRYRLLAGTGVRNISGFNSKIERLQQGSEGEFPETVPVDELEHMPHLVIILDELADLMMTAGKEVEQSIARLAQMARAAGIHLVVATQRPSVDVITGLIKANFPTRMSFMVSQKVDSRTILDRMGAENLLGQGDMLFLPPGTSRLQRIQGCFVSDEEVERVVAHLKRFGPPSYDMNILADDDEEGGKDLSKDDYDQLFDEAVAIVVESNNPSISYLQRRLKIGYNRSARIIERMEYDSIISKPDHRGVRKVFAPQTGDPD